MGHAQPLATGAGSVPAADLPKPLHIALFVHVYYPDHFYGTEAYTRILARQFRDAGHRVTVVAARPMDEAPQENLVDRYEIDGIPVLRIDRTRLPEIAPRHSYSQPELEPVLEGILKELKPDLVHICHLAQHTVALPAVAARLKIPLFATLTDFFNLCLNNSSLETTDGALCAGPNRARSNCMTCGISFMANGEPTRGWRALAHPSLRPLAANFAALYPFLLPPRLHAYARSVIDRPEVFRDAMREYAAAIAPSRFLKHAFETNGCPAPLTFSSFGLDIDRSPKPARRDGPLKIGFVGQLLYHKGPHILLQALQYIPAELYTVEIWGSEDQAPDYARDLRAVARDMPAAFRGTFAPAEAAAVMAELDLLVLPSTWYENSPLTLLKALATHTPVVVSDVEGMTEFITEGESGFAFERGNPQALHAILARLVRNPDMVRAMSLTTRYDRTEKDMALDLLRLYRRHGLG